MSQFVKIGNNKYNINYIKSVHYNSDEATIVIKNTKRVVLGPQCPTTYEYQLNDDIDTYKAGSRAYNDLVNFIDRL